MRGRRLPVVPVLMLLALAATPAWGERPESDSIPGSRMIGDLFGFRPIVIGGITIVIGGITIVIGGTKDCPIPPDPDPLPPYDRC
jgi:hypothetical protein